MLGNLNRRQRWIIWAVALWISIVCICGFLNVRWGLTAVLLAAIPAIILGMLLAHPAQPLGQTRAEASRRPRRIWIWVLALGVTCFCLGVVFSLRTARREQHTSPPAAEDAGSTVPKPAQTFHEALAEWKMISSSDGYGKLPAEDKL